ncbi:MAG: alpha/beta hydrolase [Chloroflexota bacterium]|nr:alpha/beta hydrolase [Chloroflexota bacterium]
MPFIDQVDPEILHALTAHQAERYRAIGDDPPKARAMTDAVNRETRANLPPTEVEITELTIPGPDCDIPLAIYQPPGAGPRGGLLWFHGGGYIVGDERDDARCIEIAEFVGCAVVSVGYRLTPEATFREIISDSFTALNWMVDQAPELGIDRRRVAIGGRSAGGGLSAGLALYNRDNKGPELAFQLLIYPMLDDRHETPSSREITHPSVWNREVSIKAWKMYLGDDYGSSDVSPYAAPTRAADLSGLPPALVTVGTLDLFRDENIDYARSLLAAGVATELQVYARVYHGAETKAPDAYVSKRMRRGYLEPLRSAIG